MKRIVFSVIIAGCLACAFIIGVNRGRKVPFNTPVSTDVFKAAAASPRPSSVTLTANPLILSLPVSAGRMEITCASWSQYQVAKARAGL